MTGVLIGFYVGAIVLANALVTAYGQAALPYTAFILIPFDLVVRDLLQDRWSSKVNLRIRMGVLIFGGSLISYWTTVASERIAIASFTAFAVTGVLDAITYQAMLKRGRFFRINTATLLAAITDSLLFAYLAFDTVQLSLVAAQIGSKVVGGFFWSLILLPFFRKRCDHPLSEGKTICECTTSKKKELV